MSVKKIIPYLGAAALMAGSFSVAMAKPASPASPGQKLGYAIGVQLGKQFKLHDISLSSRSLSQGFRDAYAGRKLKMTDKQMMATMNSFRQKAAAKAQQKMAAAGQSNLTAGSKFLRANATKPGVKVTKSGLQYKVVQKGVGPQPKATDWVKVDYEGKLMNGKVFDSSYKRGTPATFPVNGLIKGWTEALKMMHVGGTWFNHRSF